MSRSDLRFNGERLVMARTARSEHRPLLGRQAAFMEQPLIVVTSCSRADRGRWLRFPVWPAISEAARSASRPCDASGIFYEKVALFGRAVPGFANGLGTLGQHRRFSQVGNV